MTDMAFDDLEKIYDLLARTLDEVGEENHALFLSKLVMLLAQKSGDRQAVEQAVDDARRRLLEP